MSNRVAIGDFAIEVSPNHIYLDPNLPKSYDYVPWNVIAQILNEIGYSSSSLIDIGANVGDSLAHFRRNSMAPALCVEPDSAFFSLLVSNSAQFSDITLRNSLLVPEELVGRTAFQAGGQTGSSKEAGEGDIPWAGDYITFKEILGWLEGPGIIKSDTDGFDALIIKALIPHLQRHFIPLIFFEGPTAEQQIQADFSDYLTACHALQRMGYHLLLLTNIGMPYANVGTNEQQLVACLNALTVGYVRQAPLCHYYDIIALHPSAVSKTHSLLMPWPDELWSLK